MCCRNDHRHVWGRPPSQREVHGRVELQDRGPLRDRTHRKKRIRNRERYSIWAVFKFLWGFWMFRPFMVSRPGHRTAICTTRYQPFVPQLVQFLIITRIFSVVILIFRYFMWLVYMSFALTNKPFWPTVKYQTVFSPLKFSRLLTRFSMPSRQGPDTLTYSMF